MNERTTIRVNHQPFSGDFGVLICASDSSRVTHVAGPICFLPVEKDQRIEPSLNLSYDDAVRLMDELWNAGLRPTCEGTAGQLAATQAHLNDMRRLVFEGVREKS